MVTASRRCPLVNWPVGGETVAFGWSAPSDSRKTRMATGPDTSSNCPAGSVMKKSTVNVCPLARGAGTPLVKSTIVGGGISG